MKVKDIINLFLTDLKLTYSENEIRNFIFYSFEYLFGYNRTDMILKKEEIIDTGNIQKLNEILYSLKQQKPIQYILGKTEFYGLPFNVNNNVLIPRPETEELVRWIILENRGKVDTILDIGTGSGCIAISLKKNMSETEIFALDNSVKAIETARENASLNMTSINFILADILGNTESLILPNFDIIVSNPPYVRKSEKLLMKSNVLNYEPHEALFVSNDDALLFYKAITDFALKKLNPSGKLYFEINEMYGSEIVEMIKGKGLHEVEIRKDISGKDRMLRCFNIH